MRARARARRPGRLLSPQVEPTKELIVGSYAYLNGELFVRVALAMDAICAELTAKRPKVALAYLCTPTDVHLIPAAAAGAARANYARASLWQTLARLLSGGK